MKKIRLQKFNICFLPSFFALFSVTFSFIILYDIHKNYIHVAELFLCNLVYVYVAICRFCAVRRVIIIWFYLLFSNYSNKVFNIPFIFDFFFVCFDFHFVYSVFLYCFVYCFSLYIALFYFCTSLPTADTDWTPNCSKQISYSIIWYSVSLRWHNLF